MISIIMGLVAMGRDYCDQFASSNETSNLNWLEKIQILFDMCLSRGGGETTAHVLTVGTERKFMLRVCEIHH